MNITARNSIATFKNKTYPICFGKNGYASDKIEGDGKTPLGIFPLRKLYYRVDKIGLPAVELSTRALSPQDGWCDDPQSPSYNKFVSLPFEGSHERLWREDDVYDLIIGVGYNDDPVFPGKGSAIFIHIARENLTPTEGCIAFRKRDLLEILPLLTHKSKIEILEPTEK